VVKVLSIQLKGTAEVSETQSKIWPTVRGTEFTPQGEVLARNEGTDSREVRGCQQHR
jgi:hypothetical protein